MSDFWFINPYASTSDPEPILRDVFDGWNTGTALFCYLSDLTDMPWKDAIQVDDAVLDIAYFGNHSGGKFCSPIVKLSIDAETGKVTTAARETIAKILIAKYLNNWQHLWDVNTAAYNPIHNYNMTETRNLRTAESQSDHLKHEASDESSSGSDSTDMGYKYGINTDLDSPKPSDKNVNSSSSSSESSSEYTDKRNKVGAGEEEEEIHRLGNIGVTTTQKMIQDERELWIWNYFDQVFRDLDRELALMFHDSCRV